MIMPGTSRSREWPHDTQKQINCHSNVNSRGHGQTYGARTPTTEFTSLPADAGHGSDRRHPHRHAVNYGVFAQPACTAGIGSWEGEMRGSKPNIVGKAAIRCVAYTLHFFILICFAAADGTAQSASHSTSSYGDALLSEKNDDIVLDLDNFAEFSIPYNKIEDVINIYCGKGSSFVRFDPLIKSNLDYYNPLGKKIRSVKIDKDMSPIWCNHASTAVVLGPLYEEGETSFDATTKEGMPLGKKVNQYQIINIVDKTITNLRSPRLIHLFDTKFISFSDQCESDQKVIGADKINIQLVCGNQKYEKYSISEGGMNYNFSSNTIFINGRTFILDLIDNYQKVILIKIETGCKNGLIRHVKYAKSTKSLEVWCRIKNKDYYCHSNKEHKLRCEEIAAVIANMYMSSDGNIRYITYHTTLLDQTRVVIKNQNLSMLYSSLRELHLCESGYCIFLK
jgi:hypothetical protein